MRKKTILRNTTKRGTRDYVELEGSNHRYISVKKKLNKGEYKDISKDNVKILLEFLEDIEHGRYISKNGKKGARSPKRLLKIFYILKTMIKWTRGKKLTDISETQIQKIFDELNNDKIRRQDGKPYKNKRDFKKDFSVFWNWNRIKTYKTKGKKIEDITEYLTTPFESKPKFIFFTFEQLKEVILQHTNNEDLKAILMVLFDLGARPSEFYNVRFII